MHNFSRSILVMRTENYIKMYVSFRIVANKDNFRNSFIPNTGRKTQVS